MYVGYWTTSDSVVREKQTDMNNYHYDKRDVGKTLKSREVNG